MIPTYTESCGQDNECNYHDSMQAHLIERTDHSKKTASCGLLLSLLKFVAASVNRQVLDLKNCTEIIFELLNYSLAAKSANTERKTQVPSTHIRIFLESATFSFRIQKFPRPAYSNQICLSTCVR